MEQATTLGAKRLVGLGLILAHELLATTLPVPVMQWIQADLTIQSLAAQVREWLFAGSPPKSQNKAFMFNLRERLRDRVRFRLYPFLAVMTPNSKDRALASVPESLAFVYYILRPIRLTSHYGLRGARHLMKRFAGI